MNDKKLDDMIEELAGEYHDPPPTPREAIWEQIEARRRERPAPSKPSRPWWPAGLAAAAVLVIGIGIGRVTVDTPVPDPAATLAADQEADSVVFSFAALDHLRQMDLFLAAFRLEAQAGRADTSFGRWAADLLATTRLMLDSPASQDVELVTLLEDLEFVLLEIGGYVERTNAWELELIEDGLEENAVQMRLRSRLTSNDAFTAMGASE